MAHSKQLETLSAVETGKALRKALKAAFPGVKFSVKMSRGTAYGSFSISWTDGPNTSAVNVIADAFAGKGFDGMTDSTTFTGNVIEHNGEQFITGAGYVHASRSNSDNAKALAAQILADEGYTGSELDTACAIRMICNGEPVHSAAAIHHLTQK